MGCDIHAMIEAKYRYRHATDMWSWQSCGRLHIDRNYTLFSELAGVRQYDGSPAPIAGPRFDSITQGTDDETCSEDFKLWCVAYDDGHSHSYVSLDELRTADPGLAARCTLIVLAHGLDPADARMVFFFDN